VGPADHRSLGDPDRLLNRLFLLPALFGVAMIGFNMLTTAMK
jgi:hypothetical protein